MVVDCGEEKGYINIGKRTAVSTIQVHRPSVFRSAVCFLLDYGNFSSSHA